jgi:hypothetical protein
MGMASLHKAEAHSILWASDNLVPLVGSIVALIGAMGMVLYVHHHMKRLRRRI